MFTLPKTTDSPQNQGIKPSPVAKATKMEIRNLDVYYGGFHALRDIGLEVYQNEILALIGPSGCGKSTFLRCINHLEKVDAGILDGDLLAVHKTAEARSGQIVVARLGDEVTVKRLKRRGREIVLMPENAAFAPIEVDPAKTPFTIEGIGVGLVRANRPF